MNRYQQLVQKKEKLIRHKEQLKQILIWLLIVSMIVLFFWSVWTGLSAYHQSSLQALRFKDALQDKRIEPAYVIVLLDSTLSISSSFLQYQTRAVKDVVLPALGVDDALHVYSIQGNFGPQTVLCDDPLPTLSAAERKSLIDDLRSSQWAAHNVWLVQKMKTETDGVTQGCAENIRQHSQNRVDCKKQPSNPLCITELGPSFRITENEFSQKRALGDTRQSWLIILSDFQQDAAGTRNPCQDRPAKGFTDVNVVLVYPASNTFDFGQLEKCQDYFQAKQSYKVSVFAISKANLPLRDNVLLAAAEQPELHGSLAPRFLQQAKLFLLLALPVFLPVVLLRGRAMYKITQVEKKIDQIEEEGALYVHVESKE